MNFGVQAFIPCVPKVLSISPLLHPWPRCLVFGLTAGLRVMVVTTAALSDDAASDLGEGDMSACFGWAQATTLQDETTVGPESHPV